MSWNPTSFNQNHAPDVVHEMVRTLNKLPDPVLAGAKLGMADQKGNVARGVIFANGDLDRVPSVPTGRWEAKVFTTRDDYKSDLYLPAAHFLNGLPYEAAYWAKTTFTNYSGGKATLEVWFPTS